MSEPEQIVSLIVKQTKLLMQNHWPDINDFRDGEEKIKVGFSHYIAYQGQERIVESTISFGKRMKDAITERIDTEQMPLALDTGEPKKPGKRRGRPPRNLLEKALTSVPDANNEPEEMA